ncbi:MAG TPA: tetratricopeptide repeat protein [Acidobacteriota bacterium]|nr:tetratricopeptide repeat protein [Acidobacteriota bacterium]
MKLRPQLFIGLSVLLLLCGTTTALAQDPVKPPEGVTDDSDWLYGQHLRQVQDTIMKEPDLNLRVQKLENFTKKLPPKAKILPWMETFFIQTAEEYQKAGKTQEANAVLAKIATLFPNSPTVKTQRMQEAFQKKDYPTVISLGEELNKSHPDPQITAMLAQAYMATQNGPKAAEYSQKILKENGPKQAAFYLLWLAEYHNAQKDVPKAIEHYNTFLEAFPQDAPPQGWAPDVWNRHKATAYALRGNQAYAAKDCAAATQNLQQSLKFAPKNDGAYLMIGMCQWRAQQLDQAEQSFARAVAIGGPASAKAREYLEQIWKPRHNNTLDGMDDLIAKAKADVNK